MENINLRYYPSTAYAWYQPSIYPFATRPLNDVS